MQLEKCNDPTLIKGSNQKSCDFKKISTASVEGKEIRIFKTKVHPYTKEEFLRLISLNLREGNLIIQNGINAASINEASANDHLNQAYNNSHLINVDGISIVWALRFLGYKIPERVPCPDLADEVLLLAEKKNYAVFLFGTTEKNLLLSIQNLKMQFPYLNIAGFRNGYYLSEEEETIVSQINKAKPDILLLGMPSPKKELFVERYRSELQVKYILGVGGFLDILAGEVKRAPDWIQYIGLEWFYRFAQEPQRMWKRYLLGNPKFVYLVLKEKILQVLNR